MSKAFDKSIKIVVVCHLLAMAGGCWFVLSSDWLGKLTSSLDYRVFNLVTVVVASPRDGMIVRFW